MFPVVELDFRVSMFLDGRFESIFALSLPFFEEKSISMVESWLDIVDENKDIAFRESSLLWLLLSLCAECRRRTSCLSRSRTTEGKDAAPSGMNGIVLRVTCTRQGDLYSRQPLRRWIVFLPPSPPRRRLFCRSSVAALTKPGLGRNERRHSGNTRRPVWRFAATADGNDAEVEGGRTGDNPVGPDANTVPSRPSSPSLESTRQFVALVSTTLFMGIVFSVMTVFLVTNMGFKFSVIKVLRKFIRSDLARQVLAIIGSMIFVRSGLTPLIRAIREFLGIRTPWESSIECYLLREMYSPLELLLVVAALAALSESLLPPLLSIPRSVIAVVVRSIVSLTFVMATARVVHNMKGRIFREAKWRMELEGKTTEQHRIDAIDKLLTVGIFIVASIMGLQSLGLDVNSVLAIGGVGGLAIGLAGREIFENLFSGLLIMGSRAFDVGDEVVLFSLEEKRVEGIVQDVGWYRTVVRDFEREVYVIPNSLFSRTVVLNVTRKGREWRFFEFIHLRLKDLDKVEAIVSDMRRIIRQDARVLQKLHKRAFLDEINREYISIYISFYLEATNRDAYMSLRHQLFLDFVDCVQRNGGEVAEKKLIVEYSRDAVGQVDHPSGLLPEEELQTMSMVDADAETLIQPSSDSENRQHNNIAERMSSPIDVSSMIQKISPVEEKRHITRKRDSSPGRSS